MTLVCQSDRNRNEVISVTISGYEQGRKEDLSKFQDRRYRTTLVSQSDGNRSEDIIVAVSGIRIGKKKFRRSKFLDR